MVCRLGRGRRSVGSDGPCSRIVILGVIIRSICGFFFYEKNDKRKKSCKKSFF